MYSEKRLHELCKCAINAGLVNQCGQNPDYDTVDHNTGDIIPKPLKPWFVKTAHKQDFDDEEMGNYLTKLLADNNVNCP